MNKAIFLVSIWVFLFSCKKEMLIKPPEETLSLYTLRIIEHFKDVALGFEYGNASKITRKWNQPMKVFVEGHLTSELMNKLTEAVVEINSLATDGFLIEITDDLSSSNCYLFLGAQIEYLKIFPEDKEKVESSYGYFSTWFLGDYIYKARIFVDTRLPTLDQQKSILLEELTQSLGLGRDTHKYTDSIFYESPLNNGYNEWYSAMDKEVIRLLYHPKMHVGLDKKEVDLVLRDIIENE